MMTKQRCWVQTVNKPASDTMKTPFLIRSHKEMIPLGGLLTGCKGTAPAVTEPIAFPNNSPLQSTHKTMPLRSGFQTQPQENGDSLCRQLKATLKTVWAFTERNTSLQVTTRY